jgi:hypothetical protein
MHMPDDAVQKIADKWNGQKFSNIIAAPERYFDSESKRLVTTVLGTGGLGAVAGGLFGGKQGAALGAGLGAFIGLISKYIFGKDIVSAANWLDEKLNQDPAKAQAEIDEVWSRVEEEHLDRTDVDPKAEVEAAASKDPNARDPEITEIEETWKLPAGAADAPTTVGSTAAAAAVGAAAPTVAAPTAPPVPAPVPPLSESDIAGTGAGQTGDPTAALPEPAPGAPLVPPTPAPGTSDQADVGPTITTPEAFFDAYPDADIDPYDLDPATSTLAGDSERMGAFMEKYPRVDPSMFLDAPTAPVDAPATPEAVKPPPAPTITKAERARGGASMVPKERAAERKAEERFETEKSKAVTGQNAAVAAARLRRDMESGKAAISGPEGEANMRTLAALESGAEEFSSEFPDKPVTAPKSSTDTAREAAVAKQEAAQRRAGGKQVLPPVSDTPGRIPTFIAPGGGEKGKQLLESAKTDLPAPTPGQVSASKGKVVQRQTPVKVPPIAETEGRIPSIVPMDIGIPGVGTIKGGGLGDKILESAETDLPAPKIGDIIKAKQEAAQRKAGPAIPKGTPVRGKIRDIGQVLSDVVGKTPAKTDLPAPTSEELKAARKAVMERGGKLKDKVTDALKR